MYTQHGDPVAISRRGIPFLAPSRSRSRRFRPAIRLSGLPWSLMAQSVAPDRVDLWIAGSDRASLPDDVTGLQAHGLSIHSCDDLRSYKKIIPTLVLGDAGFLVIADDDVFYPRLWLECLVRSRRLDRNEVVCGRAHRIRLDQDGNPLPYRCWESEIPEGAGSPLVFPTGIGGVLYEPGMFHPDVTRADLFQTLCPDLDDLWLYWMAMMKGATFRKIGAGSARSPGAGRSRSGFSCPTRQEGRAMTGRCPTWWRRTAASPPGKDEPWA